MPRLSFRTVLLPVMVCLLLGGCSGFDGSWFTDWPPDESKNAENAKAVENLQNQVLPPENGVLTQRDPWSWQTPEPSGQVMQPSPQSAATPIINAGQAQSLNAAMPNTVQNNMPPFGAQNTAAQPMAMQGSNNTDTPNNSGSILNKPFGQGGGFFSGIQPQNQERPSDGQNQRLAMLEAEVLRLRGQLDQLGPVLNRLVDAQTQLQQAMTQLATPQNMNVQTQTASPSSHAVMGVRLGMQGGNTRLVLDSTKPLSPQLNIDNAEGILLVDIPVASWRTAPQQYFNGHPLLRGYMTQEIPGKGTRMILNLKQPLQIVRQQALPPVDGQTYRYFIDLSAL